MLIDYFFFVPLNLGSILMNLLHFFNQLFFSFCNVVTKLQCSRLFHIWSY